MSTRPKVQYEQSIGRSDGLRGWLTAFEPGDVLEANHRRRMLELLGGAGDAFARDRYDPGHFTASAFVLSPRGDALLLVLHGRLGRWLQPGGHVEPGDADLLAAAVREVREETGLQDHALEPTGGGVFDLDIHTIPAHPARGEPTHEHFDVRFLFKAASLDLAAGDDAADVCWTPLDQVSASLTDASVMRAVYKLRQSLGTAGRSQTPRRD